MARHRPVCKNGNHVFILDDLLSVGKCRCGIIVGRMKTRLYILGTLILAAVAGLLVAHARWLSVGPRDPRFVRFMRRYDRRANAADIIPAHAVAVDQIGRASCRERV